MQEVNTQINTCSLCSAEEGENRVLYQCESCRRKVCANCSPFKSPIPYLGKTKRCRICRNCVLCYSNCLPMYTNKFISNASGTPSNLPTYATFAESKCCGDVYTHCLHPSERMSDFGQTYKSVGDFQISPLWVPDSMSVFCSSCKSSFSLFHRRHHCRVCGRVFCSKCSSSKTDLSRYGYLVEKHGLQRVCKTCYALCTSSQTHWSKLPFNIVASICSFLPPPAVHQLSVVNKTTHRWITSRDFDHTYWRYQVSSLTVPEGIAISSSFHDFLHPEQHVRFSGDVLANASEYHISVYTVSKNEELGEEGCLSCMESCHYRFAYIEKIAIPKSLKCALFFIKYPVIALRTAATRQLRLKSIKEVRVVQEAVKRQDIMSYLIRNIQFGNSEILRQKGISKEILDLMLMTIACLLNATQASLTLSHIFRENEGITTLMSILQNDFINPRASFMQSSESPLPAKQSYPQLTQPMIPHKDPSVKKLCLYTVGILMNLCNIDSKNCMELINMNGIARLTSMIQLTNERHMLYCLECIRACCRHSEVSKQHLGQCDGIIRIINCFSCTNAQVVSSAVNTAVTVLSGYPPNIRLFRLANGLNALMQIEESWVGKCCVDAAKAISNILHNDRHMVTEFLHQRGLVRMQRLFLQHRMELSGLLFGQLLNCALYTKAPLLIQAPLLSAFMQEVEMYLEWIIQKGIQPTDFTENRLSSFDRHASLMDSYINIRGERNSSLSDSSYESSTLSRQDSVVPSYVNSQICLWVGLAAGAICYLLKNEDNVQLFIDYGVEALMNRMYDHCDKQGRIFITEAFQQIQQYCEDGICTRQGGQPPMDSFGDEYEFNERFSDLAKSPDIYSPRF